MLSLLQSKKYEKLKKVSIFFLLVIIFFTSINIPLFFGINISYAQDKPVGYSGVIAVDDANREFEANLKLIKQGLLTPTAANCRNLGGWLDTLRSAECWPPLMLKSVADPIYNFSAWILSLSGWVLNTSIEFTMNSDNYNSEPIKAGWRIVRDFVNMAFIFILLYIAFMTILQISGFGTKKILVRLILIGILLNFSFFLTAFVIDSGNVLGGFFYDAATPIEATTNIEEDLNAERVERPIGLSGTLSRNLNVATILNSSESGLATENQPTLYQESLMIILGSFVLIVAAIAFLSVGIMFIARTVSLIFILVLAPAAFVAAILPKTQQYWSMWVGRLVSNTFVLPVYTFLILLVIILTNNNALCKAVDVSDRACEGKSLLGALNIGTAPLENGAILITYMLIIGFILMAQKMAKNMGDNITTATGRWAGKAVGIGAGIGGFLGRNSAGIVARMTTKSGRLQRATQSENKIAKIGSRLVLRGADAVSRTSFDARTGISGKVIGTLLGATGVDTGAIGQAGGIGGHRSAYDARRKAKLESEERRAELYGHDKSEVKSIEENIIGSHDELTDKRTGLIKEEHELNENIKVLNKSINSQRSTGATKDALKPLYDDLRNLRGQLSDKKSEIKEYRDDVDKIKRRRGMQQAQDLKERGHLFSWAQLRTKKVNTDLGRDLKKSLKSKK